MKSASFLPEIKKRSRKEYLPIRSITYKKKLVNIKDLRVNRTSRPSLSEIPTMSLSTNNNSKLQEKPSQPIKTERSLIRPHITLDFQKLRPNQNSRSFTERAKELRQTKNAFHRIQDTSKTIHSQTYREISPRNDYFQLLYDKERRRFDASEYDGINEYYNKSVIMDRIYEQGFRNPDYYTAPLKFGYLEAPDEKTIKEEYSLKIPPWVYEIENPNAEVTHLLGGTSNEINYVWEVMKGAKETIEVLKNKKKELRNEMDTLKRDFERELKDLVADSRKVFKEFRGIIHENEVNNLTDKFKMQKEICLLQREKEKIEKEIEEGLQKINAYEKNIYGRKVFELQAVKGFLDRISDNNLRLSRSKLMKNRRIIH